MSALLFNQGTSLETDSGCILDPYIPLKEALHEAYRIAKARDLKIETVQEVIHKYSFMPVWLFSVEYMVNIRLVNSALDKMCESNNPDGMPREFRLDDKL